MEPESNGAEERASGSLERVVRPRWCEHMMDDGAGYALLGEKCRLPHHPRWQYCPLCAAKRPNAEVSRSHE